jgi:membrane fusion protein (multidrug efflux system)
MTKNKKTIWKNDGKPLSRKMALLILGPLALILLGAGFYLFGDRYISTDNAYVKADKTSICTEVSGKIIQVNVADNTRVTKGEELFRIDPEPFQIAVNRAEANLNNARTEIMSLRSDYLQKQAELARAEESVTYRRSEYERYETLVKQQAVSKEKSEQTHHDFNVAVKEYEAARQGLDVLKAKLAGNPEIPVEEHPLFKRAQAELEKARLDLSRVKITAPADGVAANVTMNPGEYTVAGLPLFNTVNDLAPWIEANFKETDLTHILPGQDAEIKVDAYPGVKWHAKVVSITPATGSEFSILPAENSSGNWVKVVQRIMVRLELTDNKDKPLLAAGMSTLVTVDTVITRLGRLFGRGTEAKD